MINLKSDPGRSNEARKYGDFDVNAFYQCGSCTISCDLAKDSASFPSRTMGSAHRGFQA